MAAPLFLLAPPRSFTSVINAMIGQHPQVYGLPELNLFNVEIMKSLWHEIPGEPNVVDARLRHGLLRAVAEIYLGEQSDEAIEFARHWCAVRENRPAGEVFKEIRDRLAPLIPVEKSPAYTVDIRRMERILESCPDARFIHLTRHPVRQCESTMELSHGVFPLFVNSIEYQESRAVLEPQLAWHDININILNFLENRVPGDQHIRVRGEELLANPEENLKRICRWLCISDDGPAIECMMHPERSPFACLGPISALYGNDPKFLKGAKFRHMRQKLLRWMRRFHGAMMVRGFTRKLRPWPVNWGISVRKYIGNITTSTEQQKESDPEHEKKRLELIRRFRLDRATREGKGHIAELFGDQTKIQKTLIDLFDDDGLPPPNITIDDIIKQYRRLSGQLRWITTILLELHNKMESIDPERYRSDLADIDEFERDQAIKREQIYQDYARKMNHDRYPRLAQAIREALQASRRARELKRFLKRDIEEVHVMEVRQIERALHYLFMEYQAAPVADAESDPGIRYDAMKKEADWLEVLARELNGKLVTFKELSEAAALFLKNETAA